MKLLPQIFIGTQLLFAFGQSTSIVSAQDRVMVDEVKSTMRRAATYYREAVAVGGGYVYHYTLDFSKRWGEGLASAEQLWVQPPGTPTVGMAFLEAYSATKDNYYLEAAVEAAEALAFGQLSSGGWTNAVDLAGRKLGYRYSGGKRRKDGNSSLDDGQTQSAIKFMVLADAATNFKNPTIHESALSSLEALLKAQFPNGAFPQVWTKPVTPQPVMKASYPNYDWRTEGRIKEYWDMYTLNDNVCGYVTDTLITAYRVYKEDKYLTAVKRLGDFLLLAQMPEPQPAWSQQYNYEMKPIWARRFEPAGIAGDESQEVIDTLMTIASVTGDPKYLDPIPSALAYLKRSLLPDGQLARYYELKSNKPLYMERKDRKTYVLTYSDARLPSHYGWKWPSRIPQLEKRFEAVKRSLKAGTKTKSVSTAKVRSIISELDRQGRWISTYTGEKLVGQPKFPLKSPYLSSAVFSENLTTLSEYLKQVQRD